MIADVYLVDTRSTCGTSGTAINVPTGRITTTCAVSNFSRELSKLIREIDFEAEDKLARAKESARIAARYVPPRGRSQIIGGRNPCAPLPRRNC